MMVKIKQKYQTQSTLEKLQKEDSCFLVVWNQSIDY